MLLFLLSAILLFVTRSPWGHSPKNKKDMKPSAIQPYQEPIELSFGVNKLRIVNRLDAVSVYMRDMAGRLQLVITARGHDMYIYFEREYTTDPTSGILKISS